ncbi:NifU family protein [Actinomadura sp. HBU206391]|uniref:NifU family protein n=1 Tax=Actinomadura sp. HBU206391 TaxID=2731692 RepID=UPI00164FC295|nr:NifU family protein [Actinomadura sp. HBU206391]MBC6461882.1 NifU family protein [Actinomadura sp. HBU206391]
MPGSKDVQEVGARVERLLAEIDDPADRNRAEELVSALIEVYGGGLARILEMVGDGTARELAGDELIGSLLIVHDLHPLSTAERVRGALERVRPYLGSHAGGVELLGIDPAGIVRLRLEGNCHGCPSSQVTATMAIERAILEDAPEITEVVVEGVAAEPALLQIHPYQGKECALPEEVTT